MKKTILLSTLAFGALTSAALAEPVALSDTQLDTVTAGQFSQTNSVTVTQSNAADSVIGAVTQTNEAHVEQTNTATNVITGAAPGGDNGDE